LNKTAKKFLKMPFFKQISSNSALLLSARILSKITTILVLVGAARILGVDSFGLFNSIISLVAILSLVADFGLVLPTIRAISRTAANENEVFSRTIFSRILWSLFSIFLTVSFGWYYHFSLYLILVFSLSSVLELSATALIRAFEGRQEIKTLTLYGVIERAIFCICALGALLSFRSIEALCLGYLSANIISLLIAYRIFVGRFGRLRLRAEYSNFIAQTKIGMPFLVTSLFSAAYYKYDNLILTLFCEKREVGIYNAAMRVLDAQIFIPVSIMVSIYPILTALFQKDAGHFFLLAKQTLGLFVGIGLLLSFSIYLLAPFIIHLLYTAEYNAAISVLRILSPAILFYCIYFQLCHLLIAMDKELLFSLVMVVSALINISGNYLLVPQFGNIAVAWMRVSTEGFMALLLGIIVANEYRKRSLPVDVRLRDAQ
jgi:O-antigen/teichoic acid export membrane protein